MPRGRPGGNPDLKLYHFQAKYDWEQPCNEKMTLKLPANMKSAIKSGVLEDWQEVARQAIAAALKEKGVEIK